MKENEAIKELKENIEMPFGSDVSHEASKLAIKALEEIQQYREIGTVDDFERLVYLKERYENETYDYCGEYGTEECPKTKEIQGEEKSASKRVIDHFSKIMENAEDLMNHVKEQVNDHPGNYPCEYNLADIEESRYKTLCEVMADLLEACGLERKD